ncbi:hypothetical protein [Robertmurraya sp. GLU-23]
MVFIIKKPLSVVADAAYITSAICFHEFKETGYLDLIGAEGA